MTRQNRIISMIIVTSIIISLLFSTTVVGVSAAETATGVF